MKHGRPAKIDARDMKVVCQWLAAGGTLKDAADCLEVDYATLFRLRQKDPVFAKGVNKAIKIGKKKLLDKMGKAKPWQAAAWMLERRWGKQFGRKDKVDVTSGDEPISFTLKLDANAEENTPSRIQATTALPEAN